MRREARRAATLRFTTTAPSRARPVLVFLFIGLIGYSLSQVSIWPADADEPPLDRLSERRCRAASHPPGDQPQGFECQPAELLFLPHPLSDADSAARPSLDQPGHPL